MKLYAKMKSERNTSTLNCGSDREINIALNTGNRHKTDFTILLSTTAPDKYNLQVIDHRTDKQDTLLDVHGNLHKQATCRHDWDNYGKCCTCGKWNY